MNVEKSPISLLQERAVALGIALPIYNIFQERTSFKCVLTLDRIIVTGVGDNKKKAKHDAAEKALRIFIPGYKIASDNTDSVNNLNDQNNNNNNILNAVGQLNELSSKHCKTYPEYDDVGCINSMFIVRCSLLQYKTEGRGRTKKDAKQEAATEMLNRVTLEDFENFATRATEKQTLYAEADETVIELFKKSSIFSKCKFNECITDGGPQIINDDITKKIKGIDFLQLEKTECSEDLRKAFEQLNIHFKITTIQKEPLILSLQTDPLNNVSSQTFLRSGSSYEETELYLLKKAIVGLSIILA